MIWIIAKKELHDNLLTFRFVFSTLILFLLILAITTAGVKNFKDLSQEYMSSVKNNEKELKGNIVYSTITFHAIKPPEILSILNLGITNRLGNSIMISRMEIPNITKKYLQENPLLNMFSSLDLTLVYKIVISLLAILFGFDAISGEKEKGTLKLLIVHGVPRFKIVLGKYLGNMLTLAASFFLSLIVAFFILIGNFSGLSLANWLRILIFAAITLLFISIFLILSLILSSLTKKAAHTLILCLFFWIVFVIIIPNLATYIAAVLKPVPPENIISPNIKEINELTNAKINEWEKANSPSSLTYIGSMWPDQDQYVMLRGDANTISYYKKYFAFVEPIYRERTNAIWKVKQNYDALLKIQDKLAGDLNRVSPVGLYQEAAELISSTGRSCYDKFIDQATIYRESILRYFSAKNAFNSLRFFTVIEEKDILSSEEFAKKKWGSFPNIKDFPPIDLTDFPRFEYQKERFSDIIAKLAFFFSSFILINLILFVGSCIAFNFYDVR